MRQEDRSPIVEITIAGRSWTAIIDTGFNGDLELPEDLRPVVNPRIHGQIYSILAGGRSLVEDSYLVSFPFDGRVVEAVATFTPAEEILIGTRLLSRYRLEINFVAGAVLLDRVGP